MPLLPSLFWASIKAFVPSLRSHTCTSARARSCALDLAHTNSCIYYSYSRTLWVRGLGTERKEESWSFPRGEGQRRGTSQRWGVGRREMTQEPISSWKVGWVKPQKSMRFRNTYAPPQERFSLVAWCRKSNVAQPLGSTRVGRGPEWSGLKNLSRLLVASKGLSRQASKRGRSQRVREGGGG